MGERKSLTDRAIAQLELPVAGRLEVSDPDEPGLRLRVLPDGSRIWSFRYRNPAGAPRRVTIGAYGPDEWTISKARREARRLRHVVESGGDPQAEKEAARRTHGARRALPTFSQLADDFIADQSGGWRPSTRAAWVRYIEREIKHALGKKVPAEVTPADVRAMVDRMKNGEPAGTDEKGATIWARRPAPVAARKCFEVLRRLCAWAVWKERLQVSPCDVARPFERKRKRNRGAARVKAYTDGQLRAIFAAARGNDIEQLVALVAHTAVRSHEARAARWEDFELPTKDDGQVDETRALWRVPATMHKVGDQTGSPHLVPVGAAVLRILERIREANLAAGYPDSPWLFPAPTTSCEVCGEGAWPDARGHLDKPNKDVATLKKKAGIVDYGFLHRFRDTVKTRMSEHGVPHLVSEHVLGHVVPGIAGTYDHAEMLPQRREALEWWAGELARIARICPAGADVVPIRA